MAVVEELVGRLTLQTRGVKDAQAAVKAVKDLRAALKGLAGSARTNFDGPAKMARGLKDAQRAAERAAAAKKKLESGSGLSRADAEARKHLSTLERLRRAYQDAAKAATQLHRRPSGSSWIEGELRNLRRYQALQREVTREAGRRGVPRHRAEQMSRLPYGEAIVGREVGSAVMRGSRYATAQGANVLQETNQQRNAGMEADQIAELDRRAMDLSAQFPSVDATKIRNLGAGARNMMPDFGKAMEILPELVKAQVMLQAIKGVEAADRELDDFLKGADNFGKTENVQSLRDLINGAIKAKAVEGGQFSLSDFKAVSKTSKAAGASLSNEFLTEVMPTFAQSEGGSRFGTQVAAGAASLVSNRRTKKSTAALRSYKLLDKKGETKGVGLLQENPYEWAIKYLMPALKNKGVDINSDQAVSKAIAGIFSSSVSENEFTKFITQRDQAERNKRTYRGAKGIDAAKDQTRGDPYVGLEGLIAQIRNFLGITQSANIDVATKKMAGFTEAFGEANKKLADSPGAAQAVGVGTAVGAAGLGALSVKLIGGFVRRVLGFGGKVGAGAGGAATGAAAAEGAATGLGTAATGAAGLATAGVIGTAIGTAAGAAFAAYATTDQLPKVAAKEGPGAIDPATGERIDTEIPKTTPRLRNWIASLFGGAAEDPNATATAAREASRAREMARRDAMTPYGQKSAIGGDKGRQLLNAGGKSRLADAIQSHADTEKARLAELQSGAEKLMSTLNTQVTLKVDSSGIDVAQAKADKLKATMAGLGSVGGVGALGGASLTKGSNSFTSAGATAP